MVLKSSIVKGLVSTALLSLALGSMSCKKKDDDDDDGDGNAGVLLPEVAVSCGEENCFGESSASLTVTSEESPIQTMRMFSWITVGFPDSDTYDETLSETEGAEDIVPQDGMVGRIEAIKDDVVEMAVAAGIESCEEAPTSGTLESDNGTITWTTPTLTSPDSFPTGGQKYDIALTYEAEDGSLNARFEAICNTDAMAAVFDNLEDGETAVKNAFFFERDADNEDEMYADFFMSDPDGMLNGGSGSLELGFLMRTTEDTMQAWVTRTGEGDGGSLGYRYAINKDIDGDDLSYFIVEVATQEGGVSSAVWNAKDAVNSAAVDGGVASSSAGTSDTVFGPEQGCADGWDFTRSTQTSADTCDDLDLEEAPASGIDEDGDMSLGWIRANIADLLEDL